MEGITSRSKYRNRDLQRNSFRSVGSFMKQTGNSLEFIVNKQSIPLLLKIVKILQNFSLLYLAAEKSILRPSTNPKRPNKPWFDDDCKKAIAERKSILRQFNLRPSQDNLSEFKIAHAKARKTIKKSKPASGDSAYLD